MKQSDIFSIIIIATAGTLFSYFLVNSLLGNPDLEMANIKTIQQITPEIATPDSELFNPDAINPTVEVFVGECEDIDQNGILSREEIAICEKGEDGDDDDSDDIELVYCPDGTAVTDITLCSGHQQEYVVNDSQESGMILCPGTTNSYAEDISLCDKGV